MSKNAWPIALCAIVSLQLGPAAAAVDAIPMVLIPAGGDVQWQAGPPSLPKGIEISVLAGDPAKPGPFVLRLKMPPNIVIAPHTHATAENVTVLSGAVFHGMGEKLDVNSGDRLERGGFVYLPALMPHSVWTTGEAVEFQVTGTGPFGVNYINPADDPSKGAK
ncbi:cupin 2 conserved barrel domain protein [Methylocella silvestris BL2]|uniref:Cupin 2 conserved barrel domain protein n=1 Tax=Methylocella silvestris (strain DSM 15510 / CIP 108128 / LMG 27833 / NCIMB 13906 / BL2) TaxID=395965 RepID=B8EJV4_METSB|nr:cupin domain-containing protein [Methylocella silvestris]ACK49901.1 cupin 2 conserved barrel domain protein [Methylocella silvestris BL2]